jgi:hypothetical protein
MRLCKQFKDHRDMNMRIQQYLPGVLARQKSTKRNQASFKTLLGKNWHNLAPVLVEGETDQGEEAPMVQDPAGDEPDSQGEQRTPPPREWVKVFEQEIARWQPPKDRMLREAVDAMKNVKTQAELDLVYGLVVGVLAQRTDTPKSKTPPRKTCRNGTRMNC